MDGVNLVGEKELRVQKIREGTVIDHIPSGYALAVLRILGITGREGNVISVLMNVPSQKLGRKDIVKIEERELKQDEVDKIALIAPKATINIIKDYGVYKKQPVRLPSTIVGVIRCANPRCISNGGEPVRPTFYLKSEDPLEVRCHYCGHIMTRDEIIQQLTHS
jgi:aspartate carbamoyltransferase regulatory subunit